MKIPNPVLPFLLIVPVKNDSCLFERFFKVGKNGIFLFGISFFVLDIFSYHLYSPH